MTDTIFGPGIIETYSGTAYKFMRPDPEIVTIEDVSHALGNICRFGGHVQRYYSVAEHSVIVSRILELLGYNKELQIAGLLHDAGEAYTGDIPKPLKILIGDDFKKIAILADAAIGASFSFRASLFHHDIVKLADNIALKFEGKELMRSGAHRWNDTPLVDVPDIPEGSVLWKLGCTPESAKRLFVKRAAQLGLCPQPESIYPEITGGLEQMKAEEAASKKRNSSTVTPLWLQRGATVTQ